MFQAVVQIITRKLEPDYISPWKPGHIAKSTGTGFCVKVGNRKFILTNHHCIENATQILCRTPHSDQSFALKVYDSSPELDLALLENENSSQAAVFHGMEPVKWADKHERGEQVFVVGYPQGGVNSSATAGIISRLSQLIYSKCLVNVALQIDAAINPGNSGGPVYNAAQQVIGVAFSHRDGAQNICFVIPYFLIQHYLNYYTLKKVGKHESTKENQIRNEKFPGVCDLDAETVCLDNEAMRNYLLNSEKTGYTSGVMVTRINPFGCTSHALKPQDVICKINNIVVGNDGQVISGNQNELSEKLPVWHLIRMIYPGDQMTIEIVRQRATKTIKITLARVAKRLLPNSLQDISRDYIIFAGLVMVPLNYWYLFKPPDGLPVPDITKVHLFKFNNMYPSNDLEEIVVLKEILASPLNAGYHYENIQIVSVNEQPIKNLAHLYQLITTETSEFMKFELENGAIIIIDREKALQESKKIVQKYLGLNNYASYIR